MTVQRQFAVLAVVLLVAVAPLVVLADSGTLFADWEDGNPPSGFAAQSNIVYQGDYSGEENTDGNPTTIDVTDGSYDNISWALQYNSLGNADWPQWQIEDASCSGNTVGSFYVDSNGGIEHNPGSGRINLGLDITADTWYVFRLANISYSSNEFDAELYYSNGTQKGVKKNVDMTDTPNNIGCGQWQNGDGSTIYIDEYKANYPAPSVNGETTTSDSGVQQTWLVDDQDPTHDWTAKDTTVQLWESREGDDPAWLSLGTTSLNWQNGSTYTGLSEDRRYRYQLLLGDNVGMYEVIGMKVTDDQPVSEDDATVGYVPDPSTIVIGSGRNTGTATATQTVTESPTGTATATTTGTATETGAGSGCLASTWADSKYVYASFEPCGGFRFAYIDLEFSGPNGSTYYYNQSFDPPTSYYTAQFSRPYTGMNNTTDWELNYSVRDGAGQWQNGTLDFNSSATLNSSLVGGGSFAPAGGSGGGGAPLVLFGAVIATALAYYYRSPRRQRQLRNQLKTAANTARQTLGRVR